MSFDEKCDVYYIVCSKFTRLCPRLVPSPLWGLSLANLAKANPLCMNAVCDSCADVINVFREWWYSLDRGICRFCGAKASHVDEDWRYYLYDVSGGQICGEALLKSVKGVAYLHSLVPICKSCHIAKHLGCASVVERSEEALNKLAKVNGVSVEEARKLENFVFAIWRRLSTINDWRIIIGSIGIDEYVRKRLEEMLNIMYSKGLYFDGPWLWYRSRYEEFNSLKALKETKDLFAEVINRCGLSDIVKCQETLLSIVKDKLLSIGIIVLDNGFKFFINLLMGSDITRSIIRGLITVGDALTMGLLADEMVGSLCGKWMLFTKAEKAPYIFRQIIDLLEESKLGFQAKMWCRDVEAGKEIPIIVYIPSSLALDYVSQVCNIIENARNSFEVRKPLYFKPDLFTLQGIYSGVSELKPYIYLKI
jgi:hypothetical protein